MFSIINNILQLLNFKYRLVKAVIFMKTASAVVVAKANSSLGVIRNRD